MMQVGSVAKNGSIWLRRSCRRRTLRSVEVDAVELEHVLREIDADHRYFGHVWSPVLG